MPIIVKNPNPICQIVSYIKECKEILQLDYGLTKVLVLLCSWVQARTHGPHANTKKDEFGSTLVNFIRLILAKEKPFVFPSQVEQVFFYDSIQKPGWKVILHKATRSRQVVGDQNNVTLPTNPMLDIVDQNARL